MIEPTVGRIVWYRNAALPDQQPLAAIVTYVHSNTQINVSVFDPNGGRFGRANVALLQDEQGVNPTTDYCEWMPYQKQQAAIAEHLHPKAKK